MNIVAGPVVTEGRTLHAPTLIVTMTVSLWVLTGCADAPPVPVPLTSIQTYPQQVPKVVVSGVAQNIAVFYSTNPDCTTQGIPVLRIVTSPVHGTLVSEQGDDYTTYAKDDQRYECNKHKMPMIRLTYQSNAGYVGTDTAKVEVIYPTGGYRSNTYCITIK